MGGDFYSYLPRSELYCRLSGQSQPFFCVRFLYF
ncbi:hypothetical protein LINGRAHAP2_LOCUS24348 [Linum grandiflorum]